MQSFCSWTLVVLLVASLADVFASSTRPRPLRRIEHPSTLVLEILRPYSPHTPRSSDPVLHHTDSIRLTLSSFSQLYHLHLQPNNHLIHPSAHINYFRIAHDGSSILDRSIPLMREAAMAYEGDVVQAEHSFQRLREDAAGGLRDAPSRSIGWARIIVHHQGDIARDLAPVFEGAFSINGVVHHVVTTENYLRNRHPLDPHVGQSDVLDRNLVIYRDSDIMSAAEEQSVDWTPPSCSHDSLEYNRDTENHPVLRLGLPNSHILSTPSSSWLNPFGFGRSEESQLVDGNLGYSVLKRDDLSGNVSSK